MTLRTAVKAQITGVVATPYTPAASDTFKWGDDTVLFVNNGAGAPINVTVTVPGNTEFGQAEPDVVVAVANGTSKVIGPFPQELRDDDGLVTVAFSSTTTITAQLLKL